ncbi:MAG: hypothetical protein Q8P61_02740 [Candidatus Nanopelagicales bacterium]|nr:hypothetical protein [Candidatus Nanopelagicales bacterium]
MNADEAVTPDEAGGKPGQGRETGEPWWHQAAEESAHQAEGSTAALLGVALEEVMKLAEGVQRLGSQAHVGQVFRGVAEEVASAWNSAPQADVKYCRVCPFCRTLGAIDTTNPDLAQHILEIMAALSEMLHAVGQSAFSDSGESAP